MTTNISSLSRDTFRRLCMFAFLYLLSILAWIVFRQYIFWIVDTSATGSAVTMPPILLLGAGGLVALMGLFVFLDFVSLQFDDQSISRPLELPLYLVTGTGFPLIYAMLVLVAADRPDNWLQQFRWGFWPEIVSLLSSVLLLNSLRRPAAVLGQDREAEE